MNKYKFPIIVGFLFLTIFVIQTVYAASLTYNVLVDGNNRPAKDGSACTVSTSTNVMVSNSTATRILATSTQRAWARISIGDNATNTISLSFNQDVAAVAENGLAIGLSGQGQAAGSTSTPSVDFGLTTVLPYTGSVTGLADNGIARVLITQCDY